MVDSKGKLNELLEKIVKEENYTEGRITIDTITSDGANFSSILYAVTISKPLKPDINLFAKVANLNEETRTNNEMLSKVYMVEAMFYTELAVNFERIYKKNNVAAEHRLNLPKYYGHDLTKMEEVMILENLHAKGFQNFNRMKTFNWEYASTAVQQMARFHALGFAFRYENPAEFERIVDQFKLDTMDGMNSQRMFMTQAVKNTCDAIGNEYGERLLRFFARNDTAGLMQRIFSDKTLLVHGDYRPSNLMHRRRNGKLEIIPLDYQTLRMRSPLSDLMHFIFSGSDEEFRRLHYQRLLDHYHSELTLSLQRLHIDVEKVYSKKTFEQDMLDKKPLGLILGIMLVPLVTVDPGDAPKIEDDLADIFIKPNELARERLLGIVRDYVRWDVI